MTLLGELGNLEFWSGFLVHIPRTQALWGNICLSCLIRTSSSWTSDVKSRASQTWPIGPHISSYIWRYICFSPGLTPLRKVARYKFFFSLATLSSAKAGGNKSPCIPQKRKRADGGKWLTQGHRWSQQTNWEWSSILWLWNTALTTGSHLFFKKKLSAHSQLPQVSVGSGSGVFYPQPSHPNPWTTGLQI